jgi:hypothetical protein
MWINPKYRDQYEQPAPTAETGPRSPVVPEVERP